jgi:hypothetical protein
MVMLLLHRAFISDRALPPRLIACDTLRRAGTGPGNMRQEQ